MIKSIKLTNFRQHRDLTINLTPGLNVIRGANEAGKSTSIEALGYAFYGTFALAESLSEVVTWGEAESSLRVEVSFNFDGVDGLVKRGKSGAVCLYGSTLVSGQSEVTKFFEGLFGVTKDRAMQLQIASQGKVRGAIEGSDAVALIESLGEFVLLDELITRIQTHRPYGNTKVVQDRIARLTDVAATELPAAPSRQPVVEAEAALAVAAADAAAAQTALVHAHDAAESARRLIQAHRDATKALADAEAQANRLAAALEEPEPAKGASAEQIADWRTAHAELRDAARLRALKATPVPICDVAWEGGRAAFDAAVQETMSQLAVEVLMEGKYRLQIERRLVLRINDKNCAFCKKDLSDVPEVALKNAEIDAEVIELRVSLDETLRRKKVAEEENSAYAKLTAVDNAIRNKFSDTTYWLLDMEHVPAKPTWVGPDVGESGDQPDFAAKISRAEEANAKHFAWGTRQVTHRGQMTEVQVKIASIAVPNLGNAEEVVQAATVAASAAVEANGAVLAKKAAVRLAESGYEHQLELNAMQAAQLEKAKAELDSAKTELKETDFYNALIRKIQLARPAVSNELWSLVLSGVSHYTTQGREEPSVVTRNGKVFNINGKALAGYSGSAKDVLGLAVRLSLMNTFLPGAAWMMLDEITAACDSDRELALLGMILEAGIPQVLLVTHSAAAESFAANLVQL